MPAPRLGGRLAELYEQGKARQRALNRAPPPAAPRRVPAARPAGHASQPRRPSAPGPARAGPRIPASGRRASKAHGSAASPPQPPAPPHCGRSRSGAASAAGGSSPAAPRPESPAGPSPAQHPPAERAAARGLRALSPGPDFGSGPAAAAPLQRRSPVSPPPAPPSPCPAAMRAACRSACQVQPGRRTSPASSISKQVSSSSSSRWTRDLGRRLPRGAEGGGGAAGEMEAAHDHIVYLALEGRELLHSARGPPTPPRQAQSSVSQGLTLSGESALPLPCGSWRCTAQGSTVELVPGGGGLLRVTALLQRADGSWRTAAVDYDDGDELNNRDGEFVHSVYHDSGDACCGLGIKGRERRGMPTGDHTACADCALRILRRSPDRPCCDAATQCDLPLPCPPPEPPAAQPRGSGAEPAPTAERASWRAGAAAQAVVDGESASRALLEEFALDWGQFRIMWEDDLCAIGAISDMQRVATRAMELGAKHQALVEQHQRLAADHRDLQRSYQRMAQRSAAVAAVAQQFRVARVLGRGSYGTVLQTVPDHGGAPEVVKVPHDDGAAAHEARGARLVRRAFGRAPPPGLEGLVPRGELRLEGRQCMLYPLCGGGNMHTLVQSGKLAPKRVEQHARRLLGGLQALHGAKLVHSDIKLENILITSSGQPTLADVGLLRTESECARRSEGGWGTPAYLSPEAEAGPSGCPADMWALGCALWEMLLGDTTWWSEVLSDGMSHSDRAAWAAQRAERVPAALRALIGGLLRTAPARRLTAAQAAAALR